MADVHEIHEVSTKYLDNKSGAAFQVPETSSEQCSTISFLYAAAIALGKW